MAVVLACVLAGSVLSAPAGATPVFSCDYRVRSWPTGFSAELSITNHGPAISSWQAGWTFRTATELAGSWQAKVSQRTPYDMSAVNMTWNGFIGSGQMRTFGWTAFAVSTEVPDDITVNGIPC
ncbi:hypothetical protein Aph01nite_80190 [Acrocarpospora phusangensis]|uniref:CBM2 domain-containing protein n=1 Tax=Acrocarpospora phusangensis TaxID=1070424 RepID=A0A919QKA3_9ACTN|nr:cellulose binding domain-containing protein [Acrocarpospora phusangensis]GIH29709.1 hypothetical protein Aph01nite_80190 [Acrocarpospora phusangensis]